MLTGEVKKILINLLVDMVEKHKKARSTVSDEVVRAFLTPRKLNF
jgi:tryptophanyl-tRNA synthetase